MTQETTQKQVPGRAEKPTGPTSITEQPKGRAGGNQAVVELTEVDLQAVSGGGGKGGVQGGDINR